MSGESSFKNEAEVFSRYECHESESSEDPSISSSLAGLNILDSSDDAQNINVSVSILADFNPKENNDKEQQRPISSLPTLSPMSK